MSSSLKNLQCIAVCAEVDCSETKSIMPLIHRIGRLQNHSIHQPTDEPCGSLVLLALQAGLQGAPLECTGEAQDSLVHGIGRLPTAPLG